MSKQIVILGAGYGGLLAALNVRKYYSKSEAQVTVINQYPTHKSSLNYTALQLVTCLSKQLQCHQKLFKGKDIDLKIATVESFSVDSKEIKLAGGTTLSYDACSCFRK